MKSLGIELLRREFTSSRKRFRLGLFLDVERTDICFLVYRCAVSDEFFLLLAALQGGVRPEQAIDQLALLVLSAKTGQSSQQWYRDRQ